MPLPLAQLQDLRDRLSDRFRPWSRSAQFWIRAADIYSSYKVCQLRAGFVRDEEEREAMWEEQHELGAQKMYSLCSDLGGLFLKAAQILGKPDLAPTAWVKRLVTLCDKAPSTPIDVVRDVVEKQFGKSFDEIFECFDVEPVGSASIAQVHRARLKLSKTDVAVKGGEDDGDDVDMDQRSDEDQETNPLLLSLDTEKPTKEQIVKQWYSQDVFTEAGTAVAEQSDSEDQREKSCKNLKKKMDSEKKEKPAKAQRSQQDNFEIVPAEPVRTEEDSSSSSDESDEPEEDLDDNTKAEVLAYAHKMLRKKHREQILDDAYNRYMFDNEGLPKWFVEDEKRHTQPRHVKR